LLEVLECAGAGAQTEITMRDEESALSFEIVADRSGSSADEAITGLEGLRDRVEALGGQLTIWSERGDGIRVAGSFPLKR
jgi:signal transduction histidine kinase